PTCGSGLVKKHGRFGEFIGCSAYPKCKYTRPITMGIACPKCKEGAFVRRGSAGKGGRGRPRIFYGCSRYPDCDFTTPYMPIAEPCPKCGAPFIVEKRSKIGTVHACLKEGCDWEKLVQSQPSFRQACTVPKGRLRLGETRARGAARSATRRSSRAGGGQVLSPLAPENILLKFTFSHRRRTYTVRKALLVGRPK